MFPPAPARFSTTTDWPESALSLFASMRPIRSVTPPAANGTTMRMGFTGYSCAVLGEIANTNESKIPQVALIVELFIASRFQRYDTRSFRFSIMRAERGGLRRV